MRPTIYTLLIAFFCVLSSCRGNIDNQIQEAKSLIYTYPDSAEIILERLHANHVTARQHATIALYRAMISQHKSEFAKSDSLVRIANLYFDNSGDSLEIQTLHLLSETTFHHRHRCDTALMLAWKANKLASKRNDHYHAALTSLTISKIYKTLHKGAKELKWAKKARRELFKLSDKRLISQTDPVIIRALIRAGKIPEAQHWFNNINCSYDTCDTDLHHLIILTEAELMEAQDKYDGALHSYIRLNKDGYAFDSNTWNHVADLYLKTGDIEKARASLDSAQSLKMSPDERLYGDYIEAKISGYSRNYKEAYSKAMQLAIAQKHGYDSIMVAKAPDILEDFIEKDNIKAKQESHNLKLIIFIGSIVILFLCILALSITGFFKKRAALKRIETELLLDNILKLKYDLSTVQSKIDDASKNKTGLLSKQSLAGIKEYISSLNDVFENSYQYLSSEKIGTRIPDDIKGSLENMSDPRNIEMLNHSIDLLSEGWMDDFINKMPNLLDVQYQLVRYLYMGFTSGSMAVLMKRPTKEAVYKLKNRLKNAILSSGCVDSEKYIEELGLGRHKKRQNLN